MYVFASDTSQLRGEHRLRPGGLATVIRQVLAPQSWGWFLRPTRLVLALRRPFSFSCTSTWMPLKSLNILSLPLADFITPADCSSWELRLRQFTALGGTDVAVAPGGGRHIVFFSHVDLPPHSLLPSGHWRLWARLLNFFFLLHLNRRWTSTPACAVAFPNVDYCRPTAATGCLYVYELPLRLASTTCLYLYSLPLRPASTVCLYGLPLRPASRACLYGLPMSSSSSSIPCSSATSIFLFM
jgi:hypothetical protein